MFAIFKKDLLVNFWSNQIGDVFINATCKGLKIESSEVDLNWYYINEVPQFYEFDQDKKLIIKKEIITINEVLTQNELGEDVITHEEIKTCEIERIIEPVVYFAKGLMIKPC